MKGLPVLPSPQIKRLSGWLHAGATLAIVILPLLVLFMVYSYWADPALLAQAFPDLPPETTFTSAKALLVIGMGATLLVPGVAALIQMRHLFRRYRGGEILTPACATHIRRIGQLLAALAALRLVMPSLQTVALTLGNPPGSRAVAVQLNSDTLAFFLAGGLLIVIGWAMAEAARAAEENAGFV